MKKKSKELDDNIFPVPDDKMGKLVECGIEKKSAVFIKNKLSLLNKNILAEFNTNDSDKRNEENCFYKYKPSDQVEELMFIMTEFCFVLKWGGILDSIKNYKSPTLAVVAVEAAIGGKAPPSFIPVGTRRRGAFQRQSVFFKQATLHMGFFRLISIFAGQPKSVREAKLLELYVDKKNTVDTRRKASMVSGGDGIVLFEVRASVCVWPGEERVIC